MDLIYTLKHFWVLWTYLFLGCVLVSWATIRDIKRGLYKRNSPKPDDPVLRCHAYEGIIEDWLAKNRVIHRLEKRICQLKRANRNLREEVKRKGA